VIGEKEMKPHEVLKKFSGHPRFDEVQEEYLFLLNSGKSSSEILERLNKHYPYQKMKENSVPIEYVYPLDSIIQGKALDQIHTAGKIPPALKGALLPDVHPGYALPIGGVVALDNGVSPAFVGYDISCRMHLSLLDMPVEDLEKYKETFLKALRKVTSFGLGADFELGEREHPVMLDPLWQEIPKLKSLKALAQQQLGSSGGGNHFADLMLLNQDGKEMVALLTHSGSRGTGHKLATHYSAVAQKETRASTKGVPKDYAWLSLDSDAGREYWKVMNLMNWYAKANHELIHHHFVEEIGVSVYGVYSNDHNLAWREEIELDGKKVEAIVHRKGATPAHKGEWGVIPGTCGTTSYLVKGLGYEPTMNSASHGAGRPRSRSASKKIHNEKEFRKYMEEQGILYAGIEGDETPLAYKDIENVIKPQVGLNIEVVATLTPKVVVMGGRSDDGD
jgi:tRNA-splicing ligase RtcB